MEIDDTSNPTSLCLFFPVRLGRWSTRPSRLLAPTDRQHTQEQKNGKHRYHDHERKPCAEETCTDRADRLVLDCRMEVGDRVCSGLSERATTTVLRVVASCTPLRRRIDQRRVNMRRQIRQLDVPATSKQMILDEILPSPVLEAKLDKEKSKNKNLQEKKTSIIYCKASR